MESVYGWVCVHLCERKVNVLNLSLTLFSFSFNIIIACSSSHFFKATYIFFSQKTIASFLLQETFLSGHIKRCLFLYRFITLSLSCRIQPLPWLQLFLLCFVSKEVFSKGFTLENFSFDLLGGNACAFPHVYQAMNDGNASSMPLHCSSSWILLQWLLDLQSGCRGKWSPIICTSYWGLSP